MILAWLLKKQAQESPKRPLPVGLEDFHEWSDRIIFKAGLLSTPESQKWALANMITTLGQGVAAEKDEYFINALQRAAANQVAIYYKEKIYPEVKARLAKEEAEKQSTGEATPPQGGDGKVLAPKADTGANPELGAKA